MNILFFMILLFFISFFAVCFYRFYHCLWNARLFLFIIFLLGPASWSAPCDPVSYTFALESPAELSNRLSGSSSSFVMPQMIKVTQTKGNNTGEGELYDDDGFTSAYILLSSLADKVEVQRTPEKGDIPSTSIALLSTSEYTKEIDDLQAYLGIYRKYILDKLSKYNGRTSFCSSSRMGEEACTRMIRNNKSQLKYKNSLDSILSTVDRVSSSLRYKAHEGETTDKPHVDISIAVSEMKNLIKCFCWYKRHCVNICAKDSKFLITSGMNQSCGFANCDNMPPPNHNSVFNDSGPYRRESFIKRVGEGKILPTITYQNEKNCKHTFEIKKASTPRPTWNERDIQQIQKEMQRQINRSVQ